jgi:hypothetical protein
VHYMSLLRNFSYIFFSEPVLLFTSYLLEGAGMMDFG